MAVCGIGTNIQLYFDYDNNVYCIREKRQNIGESGMKVLQVEDIEKSKKRKKILKGLSFSVDEQEIVGLLGPNGSGKSTTIKCISGLYRTDRGRIRICGNDIKSNRLEALKQIGIAMEVPALYPELSGIQNLRMAATARKVPKERVEELAVFTDLGDRLLDRTGTYSMGMKMRLNLAIAIVDQPKLVILDEPTKPFEHLKWANGRTLDLATYMKEHPYMYASDNVRAVFRVAKAMVSDVIDLFGTEVTFSDEDDAGVTVTAFTNEMAMEQFALNFAPDVTVLEPQRLREKVKSALEKALEKYE